MYMCVKLPHGDLNPGHFPLHPTSIYTNRVITTPKMRGSVILGLKYVKLSTFSILYYLKQMLLQKD